ncbi:DNA cytosine methyltransferase [Micromonospora sp. WMMD730]|uniref:DNA cytosine methyltransferase n=1 Tax=Micromonospora sp. WMMD730 TaxID=3404128 RepID=UPI003B938215
MNVLDLFAGIGGLSLGLQRAGMRIVGHVEINPFCRAVLHKHWPEVPAHDDVRTAVAWWRTETRPRIDVVAGGYPCQPDSVAGPKLGAVDARWLWPDMAEIIAALRPTWVIGENVLGHRTRGLPTVLDDLQRLGYTPHPGVLRACEMGAPHPRPRVFVLAHTNGPGRPSRCRLGSAGSTPVRAGRWPAEPRVGRVAYGLPDRVDRVAALGNAVVPAVGEHIGRLLINHYRSR